MEEEGILRGGEKAEHEKKKIIKKKKRKTHARDLNFMIRRVILLGKGFCVRQLS